MIGDFLKRLTQPDPAPMADLDSQLALAALLVRIARSDDDYAQIEMERIDRILATRYRLNPAEARSLRSPGLRATDCEVACVTATFETVPVVVMTPWSRALPRSRKCL